MGPVTQDVRLALRGFRRTPAFVASAVVVLALGIGMASAVAGVYGAVLRRPLPVRDQDGIAVLWPWHDPTVEFTPPLPDVRAFARTARTLRGAAGVAHYPATSGLPLLDGDRTVMLGRAIVTGNFFDVLGVRPVVGRLLRAEDEPTGPSNVIVLSHAAWRAHFGGDPGVVGRRLVEPYTREPLTIVGVAPPGLDYPLGVGYWMPAGRDWNPQAYVVGRLAPGATPRAAAAELLAAMRPVVPQFDLRGATGVSFAEAVAGGARPALVALGAAVALLLLLACVNVGTLLLVRAAARQRELAVRRALGARPRDVVRQLVVESALLALAGGALGLVCAEGLRRLLVALAPVQLPRLDLVRLGGMPVATTLAATLLAVLACGVLPALGGARVAPAATIRHDARSGRGSRGVRAARQWLVASQVALAVVLLAGAGLVARSLARLERQDLGFVTEHLTVVDVSWNATRDTTMAGRIRWGTAAIERLRALPGVSFATPILVPPFVGANFWRVRFDAESQSPTDRASNPHFPMESGHADYFRAFGIPIVRGRAFTSADRAGAPKVAIVSESVARRLWPDQGPIGKRLRIPVVQGAAADEDNAWRTVVGVVRDTRFRSLRETTPMVYLPWDQFDGWQGEFVVRATGDPATLAAAIRRAVREIDPELDAYHVETMDAALDEPLAQPRLTTLLLSAFSLAALLLAAVGLYGALASVVGERTRELGVRIALGATPGQVRRVVLGGALAVVGAGAAVGVAGALAGTRLLASLLYEVSPTDPVTLAGVCAVLALVALAAAYLPARRATRIDPAIALQAD